MQSFHIAQAVLGGLPIVWVPPDLDCDLFRIHGESPPSRRANRDKFRASRVEPPSPVVIILSSAASTSWPAPAEAALPLGSPFATVPLASTHQAPTPLRSR